MPFRLCDLHFSKQQKKEFDFFLYFLFISWINPFLSTEQIKPYRFGMTFTWVNDIVTLLVLHDLWLTFPLIFPLSFTGADLFSNCTEECKALGHSDRCWMPSFMPGDSRQGADYRSNLHVPGMDAVPDTEVQESVVPGDPCNRADDRSFSTFGKDKSHHGTLTRHELHTLLPSAQAPYKPTYLCEYSLKLYDFPQIWSTAIISFPNLTHGSVYIELFIFQKNM